MLSKVFEWSRVANAAPNDDFVAKRSATVASLADEMPKKPSLLVDCATAAAAGVVPRFSQDSDIVVALIEAIRKEQPAYPEALTENHADLRVCCALVCGEIAHRATTAKNGPNVNSQMMSFVICAGLQHRPISGSKHVKAMVTGLLEACSAALKVAADNTRRRYALPGYPEAVAEPTDLPAYAKDAKARMVGMARTADANAAIDREELGTLWWAFNGASETAGVQVTELDLGKAALLVGGELADLVLLPPLSTTKLLTRRLLATGRKPTTLNAQPLKELVANWDSDAAEAILSTNQKVAEFVRLNPAIFPVTWACLRIKETGSPPLGEFKKMTGWDPAGEFTASGLAQQAFDERIALRFYETNLGK